MPTNYFLHFSTGNTWSIEDPVAWALENRRTELLLRARDGLLALGNEPDPQRVLRLLVRRCRWNLVQIHETRIVVHYWGQTGLGDLRPFFKKHRLAKSKLDVVTIDRKRESMLLSPARDFLYGCEPFEGFPWELYQRRWQRRWEHSDTDWNNASPSYSNYTWADVSERRIPWSVLRAAWCRDDCPMCENCDEPLVMRSFSWWKGYLNYRWVCFECRRLFEIRPRASAWQRLSRWLEPELFPVKIHWWGVTDLRKSRTSVRVSARVEEAEQR